MQSKKIIVAVTGSIAAYKTAQLVRLLVKNNNEVKVIMTPAATAFISALTLSTLSKNPVHTEIFSESSWNNHVDLGLWADAMIVAPASANTLAKMAHGLCDNMVTAVYLSAKCPVFVAPAMDLDMWKHPSTQANIKSLISYGNHIIDVNEGELASGLYGKGRMAEPEEIVSFLTHSLDKKKDLTNKKVLITAGPSYENIDPVRFIGNNSSGKMGMALANECAQRGAQVKLILGPSQLDTSHLHGNIELKRVRSAQDMYEAAKALHAESDICIFSAAVADYTPLNVADNKIKKAGDSLTIELQRTVDIAFTLGQEKNNKQIHVGFALETENEMENALGKLKKKNFDLLVLNSLNDKGAGFAHDTNKVSIFKADGSHQTYELKSKSKVAVDIVNTLVENYVKA